LANDFLTCRLFELYSSVIDAKQLREWFDSGVRLVHNYDKKTNKKVTAKH